MAKKQQKNKKKNNRPTIARWLWNLLLVLAIISFIIAQFLIGRWCLNTLYVFEALKGNYHPVIEYVLKIINFPDGYVTWYNLGNYNFANGRYKQAEYDYYRAIMCGIPYGKECPVKVNLALSTINQISKEEWDAFFDDESEDEINVQAKIVEDKLITARSILIEDGCAHENDEDGHDENAQILKDEIDELLKRGGQDENSDGDGGGQGGNRDDNEDEGGGGAQGQSSSEKQIMEHIQNQKNKNQEERAKERQMLEDYYGLGQEENKNSSESGEGEGGESEEGEEGGSDRGNKDPEDKEWKRW